MKNQHAVALGKAGGIAGRGKAKSRTAEQCRAAAKARWNRVRADAQKTWDAVVSVVSMPNKIDHQ
jgi:hypothetical protein